MQQSRAIVLRTSIILADLTRYMRTLYQLVVFCFNRILDVSEDTNVYFDVYIEHVLIVISDQLIMTRRLPESNPTATVIGRRVYTKPQRRVGGV